MSVHTITVTQVPNTHLDLPDEEYVDEVKFTSECPGGDCSVWYECRKCEGYEPTEEETDDGEYTRHGEDHQLIDGDWMTDSGHCAITTDSGGDAMRDAAEQAGLGTHKVDLGYWGDGTWETTLIPETKEGDQ